jgi:hypothetical protein
MLNTTLRSRLVRIFESINFCIWWRRKKNTMNRPLYYYAPPSHVQSSSCAVFIMCSFRSIENATGFREQIKSPTKAGRALRALDIWA